MERLKMSLVRLSVVLLLVGAILTMAAPSTKADFISGVTISAVSNQASGQSAANLLNDNGLAGGLLGTARYDDFAVPAGLGMWCDSTPGNAAVTPQYVTFDLGGIYNLNKLHVWNYNATESWFTNRQNGLGAGWVELVRAGMKNVSIQTSPSASSPVWTDHYASLAEAPGTSGYAGQDITLNANNVRAVRIVASSDYAQSNYWGDPNPYGSYFQMTGLGKVRFDGSYVAPAPAVVSHGRQVLLDRGLQIQGEVALASVGGFSSISRFVDSNFTGMNLWANVQPSLLAQLPAGVQWARGFQPGYNDGQKYLTTAELSYKNSFVSMQYGDELTDIMDPARLTDMRTMYDSWRNSYPNAIAYTNFEYKQLTDANLRTYMTATHPDMIMFDMYPDFGFASSSRSLWYTKMQQYRLAGLEGYTTDAGVNSGPIAYGQFLNLFRYGTYSDPLPSESYVRLQQFASWAFGYTFAMAYVYNGTPGWSTAALFNGPGDTSPTRVFDYVKEANRQSRNLGPALVRLVSTGIFMQPGSGKSVSGTGVQQWSSKIGSTMGYNDYITSITPTITPGGPADSSYPDTLIGYFKPLLSSNPGYTFVDGLHFMIVNGATGTPFLPETAGDPASASAQWYHILFDFTGSEFNSLVGLSNTTGHVEFFPLQHLTGNQYALDIELEGGTGDLFAFWNSNNPLPTIPEPSMIVLLGSGAISLSCCVCRKRKCLKERGGLI
jgi:hypothetical protein